jgi:iron(II)-dependent oxidoreductase
MILTDSARELDDRQALTEHYLSMRRQSEALFDLLTEDAYYERPIALRNPIVFYEGHLPAFTVNTLAKKALGHSGIDARLEVLFARGIDPDTNGVSSAPAEEWPRRSEVREYARAADELIVDLLRREQLVQSGNPLLAGGQAVFTIIEHELMHQETLLYMFHQLPYQKKRRPADLPAPDLRTASDLRSIAVPGGKATIGKRRDEGFGWDNEFEAAQVEVDPFTIDSRSVTNADYLEFVEAGGYHGPELWTPTDWRWITEHHLEGPPFARKSGPRWLWRGMFEEIDLPESWPVWVSQVEAAAYARWRGKRLPSEPEYHRAAYFDPHRGERSQPWGEEAPTPAFGNFGACRFDPEPAGLQPRGQSALGIGELVGNGWEWTSTVFAPLPGFVPMASYPEYSADFFDGLHFVLKGASPVTPSGLVRRSFRNWFRPHYPYVYAKFRCVS